MDSLCVFFATLLASAACGRISPEKAVWEQDFTVTGSDDSASELELYYSAAGPEKLSIEIVQEGRNELAEEEGKKVVVSEVDAETVRKAEKVADRDLLNGLNRIMKNNETLQDVLKAENIHRLT